MDCVKFFQVTTFFAIPMFAAILIILNVQPHYYKYKNNKVSGEKSTTTVFVAMLIHIFAFIGFTAWRYVRQERLRNQNFVYDDVSGKNQQNPFQQGAINYEEDSVK
ncbi:hypothetical protein pb186bvf_007213 [Paramecium bursaria]